MNRTQALREAVARWGKSAAIQDHGRASASTPEQREAASQAGRALRASLPKDRKPTKDERAEIDRLLYESHRYRFTVGNIVDIAGVFQAFHVRGQGDTWEEAFRAADAR